MVSLFKYMKITRLILIYSLVFSGLVLIPRSVRAQATILTLTCTGTAATDTTALTAALASVGSTNAATFQLPYKANVAQRCKFNTIALTSNITLDNVNGSGLEVVAGQTLSGANFSAPANKQSFFGTGTVSLNSQTVSSAWFPGSDVGAQVNAANAALGANKGRINVPSGSVTISTPIVNEADRTLHFGVGTYTFTAAGPSIKFKGNNTIEGEGDATILVESGALADAIGVSSLYTITNFYGKSLGALNGALGGDNTTIKNLKIQGHAPVQTSTASISIGSFTLTDSSAPFTANMVGWTVGVAGAGAGVTTNLTALITAFTSSSQVTIDTAATSTVTNAKLFSAHFNSTDQTVSLQNCHNCTVENVTLDSTHAIGIQSGGGSLTPNGAGTGTKTVIGATNASPIVITTSAAHGYTIGDPNLRVSITGVVGNTAANGLWDITPITTTTFSLNYSTGNGAWSSGGAVKQIAFGLNNRIVNNRLLRVASQNIAPVNSRVVQISGNQISAPGQPYGPGVAVIDAEPNDNDTLRSIDIIGNQIDTTESAYNTDGAGGAKVLHGIAVQNTVALAGYGPVNVLSNTVIGTLAADATGNHVSGAGVFLGAANNTRVAGNTIRRTQQGIWLEDANYNEVENNTIVSTGAGGSAWAIQVHNSTFNNIQGNGLYVDPTDGLSFTTNRTIQEVGTSDNNKYINNYAGSIVLLGASSTIPANVNDSVQSPKFCFTGLNCEYTGVGTPEGAVTATVGSTYRNTSNGAFYTKTTGSGNTGWTVAGGSGFVNPMTTNGDMITQTAGVPARIAAGTINFVLTSQGAGLAPVWAAPGATSVCGSTTEVQFNLAGVCGSSPDFTWDNTNKRLGVGTGVPTSSLSIDSNTGGSAGGLTIGNYNVTPSATILLQGARGTGASPTAVLVNDVIGRIVSSGFDGTNFGASSPAQLAFFAGGTFTPSSHPTYTAFYNTPSGSITRAENMRISTSGLDVAAHSAFGSTATIDQTVGLSGVGPTIINARDAITSFEVGWTKMHGTFAQYDIAPSNAQGSSFEIHGGQTVINISGNQAFAGDQFGFTGTATYSGTASMNVFNGGWFDAQYAGTGATVTEMYGVKGFARTVASGTSGTIGAAVGGFFKVANGIPANIAFARGGIFYVENTSSGTITSTSTIQASTPVNSGGGTMPTIIQLDIRDPTGVCTTCYGAWIKGATLFNKIEGNLLLGDGTTPSGRVDIQGSINFTALPTPTVVTAGTPTAGGSCTAGTHSYKVTYTAVDGSQTLPSSTSNVITCVNTSGQTVGISGIPRGPIGTTSRKIYRTVAGDTGSYLLAGTVADNTTTVFSDTVADGSLGAAAPLSDKTAMINFSTGGGTTKAVITQTGYMGISQNAPAVNLHVGGKILSDPQAFYGGTSSVFGVPYAPFHYYGNPDNQSQGLHISARLTETLPNTADPATYIGIYASVDNTNGRGTLVSPVGLWGTDIVTQMFDSGLGGAATYARTAELEIGTEIDTIDDPFGPLSGGKGRANGLELLSIGGHAFRPTSYLGMWANGDSGAQWPKIGGYISRAYSYGLYFEKRSDDLISPFGTAVMFVDSPSPYVILGGARTFTNGIDLTASTITTCAFCSPAFKVSGAGVGTFGSTTTYGRLGQKVESTTTATYGGAAFSTFSTTAAEAAILDLNRSKSASIGTQTVVASGDILGHVVFRGSDGTGFIQAAIIKVSVDGTPGTNDMPGKIEFLTTPDGSATPAVNFSINNAGIITLNTTNYASCTALTTNGSAVLGCTPSTAKYKEHFVGFSGGLEAIRMITPQSFTWKSNSFLFDGGKPHLGLIAENLQLANPLLVSRMGNGDLQPEPMALFATSFSAIKEIDNRLQLMEQRMKVLEAENQQLKASFGKGRQ